MCGQKNIKDRPLINKRLSFHSRSSSVGYILMAAVFIGSGISFFLLPLPIMRPPIERTDRETCDTAADNKGKKRRNLISGAAVVRYKAYDWPNRKIKEKLASHTALDGHMLVLSSSLLTSGTSM